MVRLRILILNSWSSLDSHRWRNRETLVSRFAHISYESEGRVLKQAGICEIQCSIQDIKNGFPLSGPNASPISSCVQFWGKSCHVGQVNFCLLHQKKTFIWKNNTDSKYGLGLLQWLPICGSWMWIQRSQRSCDHYCKTSILVKFWHGLDPGKDVDADIPWTMGSSLRGC